MQIRQHQPADIPAIALLYFNTIHKVNIRDYSKQQVQAWAPAIEPAAYWRARFAERHVVVAEDNNTVLGFAEYQDDGHVDCFYVHHLHQGRGIGKAMMQDLEQALRENNISRLFAEVSLTAVGFFTACGFVAKQERVSEYNNMQFKLVLMEKYL
ncbi:MAG: GNAT family N-acetyltransferase [Gammaproteobacteria bacterium]